MQRPVANRRGAGVDFRGAGLGVEVLEHRI